jgi:hypothetical protein
METYNSQFSRDLPRLHRDLSTPYLGTKEIPDPLGAEISADEEAILSKLIFLLLLFNWMSHLNSVCTLNHV